MISRDCDHLISSLREVSATRSVANGNYAKLAVLRGSPDTRRVYEINDDNPQLLMGRGETRPYVNLFRENAITIAANSFPLCELFI